MHPASSLVCICTCSYRCKCIHANVYMDVQRSEINASITLSYSILTCEAGSPYWTYNSPIYLRLPGHKLKETAWICFLVLWSQIRVTMPRHLCGFWGFEQRSSVSVASTAFPQACVHTCSESNTCVLQQGWQLWWLLSIQASSYYWKVLQWRKNPTKTGKPET